MAFLLDVEMHGVKSRLCSERDAWTCSKEMRVGPSKTNEYIACRHVIFQEKDLRRPSSCFHKALKHWTGTNRIKCERLEEIKWNQRLCADCWIISIFYFQALESVFMESVFNTKPPQRMGICLFQSHLSANWGRSESRGCHSHSWPSKVPEIIRRNESDWMTIAAEVETVRDFKRIQETALYILFCRCTVTQLRPCFFHWRALQTLVAAPSSLLTVQHITLPFSSQSWKPKKACQLRTLSRHSSRVRSCNKFQASKHCQADAVRNYFDALSDSKQTVWCFIYLCESNNIIRHLYDCYTYIYIIHLAKCDK